MNRCRELCRLLWGEKVLPGTITGSLPPKKFCWDPAVIRNTVAVLVLGDVKERRGCKRLVFKEFLSVCVYDSRRVESVTWE